MNSRPHPTAVGPYRVVSHLGRGGLAQVYEVEAPQDGRRLALKLLEAGGLAVSRFAQEYRLLAMMDHPGVVPVMRFGTDEEGHPYFTMPLVDGEAAQSYVRARGRPGAARRLAAVVRVARSVAESLAHVHGCGVVHRDIKSSNVLVPRGGRACLIDFGTALDLRHLDVAFSHGEFVGTHAYAAPEQQTGSKVDGRADLYALGVLMHRLATGRRPFDHDDPHRLALLHLKERPERLDRLVGGVPSELADLVASLLEKRPEDRPGTAEEVVAALEALPVRSSPRRLRPARARLIGRVPEERTLAAALERPRPGRMVLVTGPLGAGRKRLVETVLERWRVLGWEVRPTALSEEQDGLGDLVQLARLAARGARGSLTSAQLEGLTSLSKGEGAVQTREELWTELMLAELRQRGRPTVLAFWGLERSTPQQRALLGRLRAKAREEDLPLVVFATALGQHDAPGCALRTDLADATRVELGPLAQAHVAGLLGELLEFRRAVPEVVQATWLATGGLPGLIEVVARTLEEQPGLGASWLHPGLGGMRLPDSIVEIFLERVRALAEAERAFVRCLCLASEPLQSPVFEGVLEWSREGVAGVADGLRRQGYVRLEAGGWELAIGLAGRVLLDDTSAVERDRLRLRLARFLPASPPRPARVRLLKAAGWRAEADAALVDLARERAGAGRLTELLPLLESVCLGRRDLPAALAVSLASCRLEVGRDEDHVLRALEAQGGGPDAHGPFAAAALHCELAARAESPEPLAAALRELAAEEPGLALELSGALRLRRGELTVDQSLPPPGVPEPGVRTAWRGTWSWLTGDPAAWGDAPGWTEEWWSQVLAVRVARSKGDWTRAQGLADRWRPASRAGVGRVPSAWFLLARIEIAVDLYRLGEARELLSVAETLVGAGAPTPLVVEVDRLAARLHLAERRPELALARLESAIPRSRRWGLGLVALRLEGWQARARLSASEHASSDDLGRVVTALWRLGARTFAAEIYGLQVAPCLDDSVGEAVERWAVGLGLRPTLLGLRLGRAEQAWRGGEEAEARRAFVLAHDAFEQLQGSQDHAERAALSAHPWRVRLRRGLSQV